MEGVNMSFKIGDVVIDLFGVECRIIEVNGDRYKVELLSTTKTSASMPCRAARRE
jgi:hypothetical protein